MSLSKFKIFPIFSNFLRYQDLKRSVTFEVTRIQSFSYKILSHVSLVMNKPVLKFCKVPKYFEEGCSKRISMQPFSPENQLMIWKKCQGIVTL